MTNMLHRIHVLSKTVYFRSKIDLNSGLTCLMNTAISQSYIDVVDGYWRRTVLMTGYSEKNFRGVFNEIKPYLNC